MKLRLVTIILALLIAIGGIGVSSTPALAMSQIIIGGYADAVSSSTEFNSVGGGYTWNTNSGYRTQVIPTAGTLSRFSVELSAAPGNSGTYTFTIRINGADSSLAAVVTDPATTVLDTDSVEVVAGDYICIVCVDSDSPSNTPTARWSVMFSGTTASESILLGVSATSTTQTRYAPIAHGSDYSTTTEASNYQIIPTGGTLKKLYVRLISDPGTNPDDYYFRLRIDGADSDDGSGNPISVTIVADNTTGSDTTHTISVSAGQYANLKIQPENTPFLNPVVGYGLVFVATTDGESLILGESSDTVTNSQTEYNYLTSTVYSKPWGTTENFQGGQAPTGSMVLKNLYVMNMAAVAAAPDEWVVTVRGGGGSTNLHVHFQDTAADNIQSDTVNTYTVASYDDLAIMAVPTDTPTAGDFRWGLVCYISSYDISVSPSSKDIGLVVPSTSYWSIGHTPDNPIDDAHCTFTLTNNGGGTIDVDVHAHDFTGAGGWTLGSPPGATTARLSIGKSGDNPASPTVITTSDQEIYDGLSAAGHFHFDILLETPTSAFTDGTQRSTTISFTAVAED